MILNKVQTLKHFSLGGGYAAWNFASVYCKLKGQSKGG